MKDEQIIKAFEELSEDNHMSTINQMICGDVLNLINRQKTEIERLKKNIDGLNIFTTNHMKVIRLQAIKEFAEKLKKRFYLCAGRCVVDVYNIDNLVKEMTEVHE